MRTAEVAKTALYVLLIALAGCPRVADEGAADADFSGSGRGTGGVPSGGGVSDPGDAGPTNPSGGGTAVGGDSSDIVTAPDELSVVFPGCEEVAEGEFWKNEILRLVNVERLAAGIDPVTWNDTLEQQATQYACELIFYDFFAHENPVTDTTLGDRARQFNYDFWMVGENLAAGQMTPIEAFDDWMNSPCHRENIMNPAFTELGVGIRYGGDYGYYWVQEFGRPFTEEPYRGEPYRDPECDHGAQ